MGSSSLTHWLGHVETQCQMSLSGGTVSDCLSDSSGHLVTAVLYGKNGTFLHFFWVCPWGIIRPVHASTRAHS